CSLMEYPYFLTRFEGQILTGRDGDESQRNSPVIALGFPRAPLCPLWFKVLTRVKEQASRVSHNKRHAGPDRDPPGESDLRPSPQIQFRRESANHADDCPTLIRALGQHAQQKHSEESPISHRGDLQPDFHHSSHPM